MTGHAGLTPNSDLHGQYYCAEFECPSHFKCDDSYCVPIRHRCDNQWDCPYGEDENNCLEFKCNGFFYCPLEQKCLSFMDVCDGKPHCKVTQIDEHYCDIRPCPKACFCVGRSIQCIDRDLTRVPVLGRNVSVLLLSCNMLSNFRFRDDSMENQQGWNGKGVLMKVHHPLQGNPRSHHKPQAVRRVGKVKGYS